MVNRVFMTTLLSFTIASCGPNPIERASQDPWSTKQDSIQAMESGKAYRPPMVVHGDTVRDRAMSILNQAIGSDDPRSRANAIEALKYADKQSLSDAVRAGLVDENRGVRFVAVMMMGGAGLCDDTVLLEPILDDPSPSVQAAVLCTLYKCGQQVDLNPIGRMLNSDDPEQRGNAALVLGEMGNASAVSMIRHASRTTPSSIPTIRRRVINLQMAEALVKLGQEKDLEIVRAAIFSSLQEAEITALACQIAGRVNDVQILSTLESIAASPDRYPDEIRLVAASSIAQIDSEKVPSDIVLSFTSSEYPLLRAQSATTLGVEGNQVNLGPLALMLKDSDPNVQIAAAGAILRIDKGDSVAGVH